MRALVTGGGGFIGRHVVDALAAAGAQVDCHTGPPGSGLAPPAAARHAFEADICDRNSLQEHAAGADVIVHLAGPPSVAESFADPCGYVRAHVEGTACVLEACRGAQVPHLVYVSSAEIYGVPCACPVDEDHPLRPRSPYGAAKAGAEKLVEAYRSCGQSAVVLRPFSVYGPGASPQSLVGRILSQLQAGGDVVVADLRPVRDYCFVSDLARAVVLASSFRGENAVFNIGSMEGTSVARVADLMVTAAGSGARVIEDTSRRRAGDILQLVGDNRRARSLLGWRPEVGLEDGLGALCKGAR